MSLALRLPDAELKVVCGAAVAWRGPGESHSNGDGGGAAGLAGCGGGDRDSAGGELVIYSGRQEALVGPLIERFQQQTGIATSVRYGNTAQLTAQLLEEGAATPADVYLSQDAGALGALGQAGRLEQLPQGVLDQVPARFRADDGSWIGTSGRARVIVYDPRQVPRAGRPGQRLRAH